MPEATVAAIITSSEGSEITVLLTLRDIEPFKGQWCLPGGHIDLYESAVDAVIREVREETGLDFVPRFFRCFDEIIPESDIHNVVMAFEGQGAGEMHIQEGEVVDMRWFPIAEARSLPLAFAHNRILDEYAIQTMSSELR